jgi:hypothetical protein
MSWGSNIGTRYVGWLDGDSFATVDDRFECTVCSEWHPVGDAYAEMHENYLSSRFYLTIYNVSKDCQERWLPDSEEA